MNLKTWRRDVRTFGLGFAMGAMGRSERWSGDTRVGRLVLRPANSDFDSFRQCFVDRQYDLDRFPQGTRARRAYHAILERGLTPLILDAGANVGAAALWFAERFPKAKIIAVEPDPDNAALARLNTAGHDIAVIEAAIGGQPGAVNVFHDPDDPQAWAIRTARTEGAGAPIVTVASLIEPGTQLFLAKIDIEGFEADLFATATGWLDQAAVVIIEPHDWMNADAHASHAFQRAMGERSFDVLIAGENLIYIA